MRKKISHVVDATTKQSHLVDATTKKILSRMELAPRHTLFTLFTMFNTVYTVC